MKLHIQRFGRFLSGMIMPNLGAFIAWGLITALFIPTGWTPHEGFSSMVGPMILNLLPILIGYTGGKMIGGQRGGVVGAVMTMGVIVGSSIPQFMGAMIVGPIGGLVISKIDEALEGKVPAGFEMLVNNFTAGIAGTLLAMIAYAIVGPVVEGISNVLGAGVQVLVDTKILPLASILVEPAKVLFLNNAINHGVLAPLGVAQAEASEAAKSIYFTIETNPGPGMGILIAYWMAGKGLAKQSSPGAMIIHFFGGIHEIYFPYILMRPILILAAIGGGASGVLMNIIFRGGLTATPSPGSIFATYIMTPKSSILATTMAVLVSTAVALIIALPLIKRNADDDAFSDAQDMKTAMKMESKGKLPSKVSSIVVACVAGMGSSAMASTMMKKALSAKGISDISVTNVNINDLSSDASIIITHQELLGQAEEKAPNAKIYTVNNFLDKNFYENVANEVAQNR